MKYMTFNSSCSFAGVANMLERKGIDAEDYEIARGMELPYIVVENDCGYMAGAMLQEKKFFDIYLKKTGYELVEEQAGRQEVFSLLRDKDCAMLGIRVDENHKHAVVYTGADADGKLVFINNRHEKSDEPCEIRLGRQELLGRLDECVTVASLKPYSGEMVNPVPFMEASLGCLDRLCERIIQFSSKPQTRENIRKTVDTLFRPLLLDSVAMMELLAADEMVRDIKKLQKSYIDVAFRNEAEQAVLSDYLDMNLVKGITDNWKELICKRIKSFRK